MWQPLKQDSEGFIYVEIPNSMARPKLLPGQDKVEIGEEPVKVEEYIPPKILEPIEMQLPIGPIQPDGRRWLPFHMEHRQKLVDLGFDPNANLTLYPMYLTPVGELLPSDMPIVLEGKAWYTQNRVNISAIIVRNTRMNEVPYATTWGFQITGFSLPKQVTRITGYEPVVEYVNRYSLDAVHLRHPFACMGPPAHKYPTWRWYLPEVYTYYPDSRYVWYTRAITLHIDSIMRTVFNLNLQNTIGAEITNPQLGSVEVELGILNPRWRGTKAGAQFCKNVAKENGYAFRSMSNRNYSLKDISAYPFLCELRASWLTMYPREIYQYHGFPKNIVDWLNTTTYNMSEFVFIQEIRDEKTKQTTLKRYLKSGKLDVWKATKKDPTVAEREPLWNDKPYGWRHGTRSSFRGKAPKFIKVDGSELNQQVDGLTFEVFPFEYCIKYARIINRRNVYYEYLDDWINSKARASDEVWVDDKGFIWKQGGT